MVEYPHSMAFPELQGYMDVHAAQMRDIFAPMTQQQQTMMEAMLNNERGRPAAQAQGYQREVLLESGELHWRAGVARLVVPIQVSNQEGQRSSVPLD